MLTIPTTIPFLGWTWNDLLFLVLAGGLLGSALMVVLSRNIIHSGLWMILGFLMLAGLYALLGAPLLAGAQVLIYIGAISVLILFAIMLTQSKAGPANLVFHHQAWAAALAAVGLGLLLVVVVGATPWPLEGPSAEAQTSTNVAALLFSDFVLPLEVVGVILLASVVGGVFLAKKDDRPGSDADR
ncbi:MAG: NADH-quinone oxidoreductase subunit J family protein [Candidatus Limnocylindrales bacterium]